MSYITVSAEKVAAAAQNIINRIKKRRKEKTEAMIARQMTKFYFQLKWPFISYYTREQAIEELLNHIWAVFPSNYAWGDLDRAETLLIMAENVDPVNISNDDARLLWG